MHTFKINDRAQWYTRNAPGTIAAVVNGGALYIFHADSGARFTVRADELSPIGAADRVAPSAPAGECRTVVRFDSPGRQRTPSQQQQARASGASMSAAHTPGPWHAEQIGNGWHALTPSGHVVATIAPLLAYRKAHGANARLIAAAPQLAEALRQIAEARCADDKYDPYTAADRYREIARAALKQAGVKP